MTQFYDFPTQQPTLRKTSRFDLSWWPIILLWGVFIVGVFVLDTTDPTRYDLSAYDVYHESAEDLIEGEDIYQGTRGWIYLYPPFMAQVLMPVAYLVDDETGGLLWLAFNFVLLIGTVSLLARHVPREWVKPLWVGAVLFMPIGQALYIGQVTILMLALLVGAWVAVKEDKRGLAGSMLAVAAWIKVFPGILMLYFLWKRDWRVIRGVVIAGLVILLFQIVVSGPVLMVDFFKTLFELTASGQPGVTHENNSILAFASRLFEQNPNVQHLVISPLLFNLTRTGLTIFVIGLTLFAIVRSNGSTARGKLDWRFDLEYSLVVLMILLFGGTLWISGMPPLLMMYVLIIKNANTYAHPGRIIFLLLISFLLITTFIPLMMIFLTADTPALLLSTGFFGVMTLWGVMVTLLLRRKPAIM
ncbi:MAG: hypothetical protein OHK0046_44980 [Anaerolineae bacterium]